MTVAKQNYKECAPVVVSCLCPFGEMLFLLSLCKPVRESLAESLGEMTQGLLLMRRPAGGKRSKTPNQRTNWNSRHLHLCFSPSFTVEASECNVSRFPHCQDHANSSFVRRTPRQSTTETLTHRRLLTHYS